MASPLFIIIILCCVVQLCTGTNKYFNYANLIFSNTTIRTATNITLMFSINYYPVLSSESILLYLPQFTRRADFSTPTAVATSDDSYNIPMGSVRLHPSSFFTAAWFEGSLPSSNYDGNVTNYDQIPYEGAYLQINLKQGDIAADPIESNITVTIYDTNGIFAYCGFASKDDHVERGDYYAAGNKPFSVKTTTTYDSYEFDTWSGIGSGCTDLDYCSGHGRCNYCYEKCECDNGYGSSTDIITTGSDITGTCAEQVCPNGKAIADIPTAATVAHSTRAECSNQGLCDRKSGTCNCFAPFTGEACNKRACPNDCSGHGTCMSMYQLSQIQSSLSASNRFTYGTAVNMDGSAWDYDTMYGCLCDSSWSVGYDSGQTQVAEWFGPDCSLRHCPSGDNPFTTANEINCRAKSQQFSSNSRALLGKTGNLCQVDCSDRGICDYSTGLCTCFEGSWGDDCGQVSNAGSHQSNMYTSYEEVSTGN